MNLINLSFRQALELAHELSIPDCICFIDGIRVHFFFGSIEVLSNSVTIDYAEKLYPLVMGQFAFKNFYNGSLLPF